MSNKLFLLFTLFCFLFFSGFDFYSETKKNGIEFQIVTDKNIQVGEDLTYVVKYTFIELGEVRIKVRDKKVIDGKNVYDAVAYIDSYTSVPFVDLHQIYQTKINENNFSEYFKGIVRHDEYSTYTIYDFVYDSSIVKIKKGRVHPPQLWTDSTAVVNQEFQDGLSILFYTRMITGQNKSINLSCFVNEKKENTKINFYDEVNDINISSVDYDISCVRIDGKMNFVSVFGLTGYFEGWFTNDEAAVPVVANMQVILGNITLELKKWKREGWKPPKYEH